MKLFSIFSIVSTAIDFSATRDKPHFNIEPYLQPIISQYTSDIAGAEILCRPLDCEGNIITNPTDFLKQLTTEEKADLDACMLEHAVHILERIKTCTTPPDNFFISVNITQETIQRENSSPQNLGLKRLDPDLLKHIKFEILETAKNSVNDMISACQSICNKAPIFGFAADDIDRSLLDKSRFELLMEMAKILPQNIQLTLKLDRSLLSNPQDISYVTGAVRAIEATTGRPILVIAEGIEYQPDIEMLDYIGGATHLQGYFFGRPAPVQDFISQLLETTPNRISSYSRHVEETASLYAS